MGSFRGHALPGTLFMLISTWWTAHISKRYFKHHSNMSLYKNDLSYPLSIRRREVPVEAILKIVGASTDIIGELCAAVQNRQEHSQADLVDIQHATISSFFLIHGICDILVSKNCLKIPLKLDYITLAMAFTVEGLMFYFHILYGRDTLDKTMHQLLLISILGCVLSVTLEYMYPHSLLFGFSRTFFTFLQGIWFFEIAFVLYPKFPWQHSWLGSEADISVFVATMFAWSIAVVMFIITIVYCITYCCMTKAVQCGDRNRTSADRSHEAVIQTKLNGGHYELLDNQTEELESILEIDTKTDY